MLVDQQNAPGDIPRQSAALRNSKIKTQKAKLWKYALEASGPASPLFAKKYSNGANGIRTHDLLHAMQALSQLSYGPSQSKY
jgi:hypothetical protein